MAIDEAVELRVPEYLVDMDAQAKQEDAISSVLEKIIAMQAIYVRTVSGEKGKERLAGSFRELSEVLNYQMVIAPKWGTSEPAEIRWEKIEKEESSPPPPSDRPTFWGEAAMVEAVLSEKPYFGHRFFLFVSPDEAALPIFRSDSPVPDLRGMKNRLIVVATPEQYTEDTPFSFAMDYSLICMKKDKKQTVEQKSGFDRETPFSATGDWIDVSARLSRNRFRYKKNPAFQSDGSRTASESGEALMRDILYPALVFAQGKYRSRYLEAPPKGGWGAWGLYADRLSKLSGHGGSGGNGDDGLIPADLAAASSGNLPYLGYRFLEPKHSLLEASGREIDRTREFEILAVPERYGETGRLWFLMRPDGLSTWDGGRTITALEELQQIAKPVFTALEPR